jgi:signal-transduction protein with cAMP-binding, CBS, and nucleotidyltransferase domain
VSPDTTAQHAAELMLTHHVGCLVVPDAQGRLAGICSERDIVRHVVAPGLEPARVTVEEIMTREVIQCGPETPVGEARAIMVRHGIRHLPVVEDGVATGMISVRDVFAQELQATQTALRQQSRSLNDLEKSHPGITRVDVSDEGMVVIEDGSDDASSLLQ